MGQIKTYKLMIIEKYFMWKSMHTDCLTKKTVKNIHLAYTLFPSSLPYI